MPFGKIVRGRKFQQVLDGARKVFLRDGFEGASVDAIAHEAGVSKATLYSYFPEKRVMLIEVARVEFERLADTAHANVDMSLPTPDILRHAARAISEGMASEFSTAVFRLAVSETPRFPAIGQEYHRAGPRLLTSRIALLLTFLSERGDLLIEDVELAADQFGELCSTRIHDLVQFGMGAKVTPELIDTIVEGTVRLFLRGYGAPHLRDA